HDPSRRTTPDPPRPPAGQRRARLRARARRRARRATACRRTRLDRAPAGVGRRPRYPAPAAASRGGAAGAGRQARRAGRRPRPRRSVRPGIYCHRLSHLYRRTRLFTGPVAAYAAWLARRTASAGRCDDRHHSLPGARGLRQLPGQRRARPAQGAGRLQDFHGALPANKPLAAGIAGSLNVWNVCVGSGVVSDTLRESDTWGLGRFWVSGSRRAPDTVRSVTWPPLRDTVPISHLAATAPTRRRLTVTCLPSAGRAR